MRIAVVIPVRNAAHLLGDCLSALRAQSRLPDEVVIAIAPSTDGTQELALSLIAQGERIVENPAADRGSGVNRALRSVEADAIAFVDAQSRPAPDYLEAAVESLESSGAAVVGGPMRAIGQSTIGRAMALALRSSFGVGDSQFHFTGRPREVESVYLGVYRMQVFRTIGTYNPALLRTEDDDLNARARAAGFRFWLDPQIRSDYLCRNSLREIWRQYFGYGFWKVALFAIRPQALRFRHLVPAAFVVALVTAGVLAAADWWYAIVLLAAVWFIGAAVFALMAGPASLAVRACFVPVALTMHLAYGVGTWLGLAALPRTRAVAVAAADEAAVPLR